MSLDQNLDSSRDNAYDFSGRLIYSHNFPSHRGRSFSLSASYSLSNTRERANSISEIVKYLLNDEEVLDQYADNHTWSNEVSSRVTWNEPLGDVTRGNFLVFSYRMSYKWNNADKFTYTLPDDYDGILPPVDLEPDPDYSRSFRNNYFNQNVRLGFKHNGPALTYEAGLALVPQMTKSVDYINSDRNLERWVMNYAPYLRMRYKWSKNRSFQANYRARSSQPSIDQMNPVPDISNPMNIKIGNPDLKPSFSHSLNVRFNDYNMEQQRSIMTGGEFSFTQNSVISKTKYDPQTARRTTEYVNVNGVWNLRLMNMMSMPLRNKSWTISSHIFGNASQSIGFNNEVRNTARDYSVFFSPGVAFRPDNFEFELRPQYRLQLSTNSMQQQSNRTIHSYGGRLDCTYYTSWGLTIQSDVNYTANKGYA
ncbi:MAG: outer membrane beta-barrel family protein, partial [Duncaniella sp.]|nr:outer membrane beta-barrel family protein [Duncaniella sp.]